MLELIQFADLQGFLTAKKYSYRIVGTEDIDHANSLLYDTYHPDEPLNKHLGLTAGGRRIKDCDAMVQVILASDWFSQIILISD